jgi:hypothetical protein
MQREKEKKRNDKALRARWGKQGRGERNKTHRELAWQLSESHGWCWASRENPKEKGGGGERIHVVVQHKELFPAVLHDFLAEVVDEVGDGDGLAVLVMGGDGELVLTLVREEHLEATPEAGQYGYFLCPLYALTTVLLQAFAACCS